MAVGHRPVLYRVSSSGSYQRHLVVLHDISGVLLVADHLPVLGRPSQGLLADVRAPHRDHPAAVLQLGLQPAQDRDARAAAARLC